ncbi:MMPL family transporter [Streptomyces boncukensis]|uniref:MMPL family transporter n=1 Tax=Streptomyces boncukensis TaxID=2711219 RepID=A0A6G4WVV7_9ACTN|nr:MMPL family transporter [Streptomyces boncukensis]NGO69248.1 MMPL family transporter [Streptomyces boncukensis]
MAALARWCLGHRWAVVLLWLVALLGTGVASTAAGTSYASNFTLPGTESTRAHDRMRDAFPELSGDTDTVVWETSGRGGSVRDPRVRARMSDALADIADMPGVGSVASPYTRRGGGTQISDDDTIAYAQVTYTQQVFELDQDDIRRVVDRARQAREGWLQVEVGGPAVELSEEPPAGLPEGAALLAAALVLLLAFGSLFTMLLPLLSAVFAVGTGLFTLGLLSHALDVPEVATLLASLIGLGVGVDYALLVVARHREGLREGLTPHGAAVRAMGTSGRAVLFAGGTVCVALLALLVLGVDFLDGIALATTLTTLLSVLAAATLLPALLGLLGPRTLSRRERARLAAARGPAAEPEPDPEPGPEPGPGAVAAARPGPAERWASVLEARPTALGLLALVVLTVLAFPAASLRLGAHDQGNLPENRTARRAYDLLVEGFGPGFNGPLTLVADVSGGERERTALAGLAERLPQQRGVARVEPVPLPRDSDTAVVQVFPETSPQSADTDDLISTLRDETVPQAERGTDLRVDIGGATATQKDFAAAIGGKMPVFIAVIFGLGALLLLIAFRSLVVPLTAVVMNLVAAAASLGVLVAVFQWGWGVELLGIGKEGPIISFLPVILLPLLFGLSMDYQVFLISRIHEEWTRTRDNARAVRTGLADTGRVITCAALIMICVFASFLLSGEPGPVMAGIGLAGAVALDAFLLRTLLVPALMFLLGRANWWLPERLGRRLPRLPWPAADPAGRPRRAAPGGPAASGGPVTAGSSGPPGGPADPGGPAGPRDAPKPGPAEEAAPAARVRGTVRDGSGGPLAEATLTLLAVNGTRISRTRTTADGEYTLPVTGSGAYIVVATSPALGATSRSVLVSDEDVELDLSVESIELSPSRPEDG